MKGTHAAQCFPCVEVIGIKREIKKYFYKGNVRDKGNWKSQIYVVVPETENTVMSLVLEIARISPAYLSIYEKYQHTHLIILFLLHPYGYPTKNFKSYASTIECWTHIGLYRCLELH